MRLRSLQISVVACLSVPLMPGTLAAPPGHARTRLLPSPRHPRGTDDSPFRWDTVLVSLGMMRRTPSTTELGRWRSSLRDGTPLVALVGQLRRSANYAGRF